MNNSQHSNNSKFIPGTELLTPRELVKKNQNQRSVPIQDKTVNKAETQLMKWNPSVSVHGDVVLALEGHHPYQNLEKESEIDIEDTNKSFIIQQWYNENYEFFFEDLSKGDNNNNNSTTTTTTGDNIIEIQKDDNGSSFLLTPIEPLTNTTPFATLSSSRYDTNVEQSQINNLQNRDNISTIGNNHKRQRFETINLNTFSISKSKSLYHLYYQQPVPLSYIGTIYDSQNGPSNSKRQLFDQQQNNTHCQEYNSIFHSCLVWSGCQQEY